jgi:hypothetical protein
MKNIYCPKCGKMLLNLQPLPSGEDSGSFWCDECCIDITLAGGTDEPVTIEGDGVRAEWVNIGEGVCGDFNPDDPEDVNLLRFDISYLTKDNQWEEVEDASYCTNISSDTSEEKLVKALYAIWKEYVAVISDYPYHSVKKLGERLSWISA